jgi:hypothetical protein
MANPTEQEEILQILMEKPPVRQVVDIRARAAALLALSMILLDHLSA